MSAGAKSEWFCSLRAAGRQRSQEKFAMTYYETQQNPMHAQFNPQQWAQFNPQSAQPYGAWLGAQGAGHGLGQAAYGQQFGQFGQHGGYGGQPPIGAFGYNAGSAAQPQWPHQQQWSQQPQWWGQQQRQLSQHDVNEVVRQLLPALPQILAQAQQPHAAPGYAAYGQGFGGQAFGQGPRLLTQHDVNEVVRQILPIMPQIVGMLQGQPQLQHAAMHGGSGAWGQGQFGPNIAGQNPFATAFQQPSSGQYGWPQFQSAFGSPHQGGQQQRQLTQQDVADVARQLVGLIPQVIGNLQAFNQQRMI
jgi:hypothetical protein